MDIRRLSLLSVIAATIWTCVKCQTNFDDATCLTLRPDLQLGINGNANPYFIGNSPSTYTPGQSESITVFLVSTDDAITQYSYVIFQVRRDGSNCPVGTFQNLPDSFEVFSCGGFSNDTLFTSQVAERDLNEFAFWIPPPENYGDLRLHATIVDTGNNVYENVMSLAPIRAPGPAQLASLSISECPGNQINGDFSDLLPTCMRGNTVIGVAECNPPPNTNFGLGTTTVECSCTECDDPAVTCSFDVTITVPPDGCEGNPCQNGGTCITAPSLPNGIFCFCEIGFSGDTCEVPPVGGICQPNPCLPPAECRVTPTAMAGYTCHIEIGVPCPSP